MDKALAKLTISLPVALHRQVKAVAALQGKTIAEVVLTALTGYVAQAWEEDALQTVLNARANPDAKRDELHDWAEIKTQLSARGNGVRSVQTGSNEQEARHQSEEQTRVAVS